MAGRPPGAQNKDKPFRQALKMELAAAGEDMKRLRAIARAFLDRCEQGDTQAIKELADRLDGKVPQAVVGDDEHPPVYFTQIELVAATGSNVESEG
jgi:hypothetical protein